jgi:hypothetical protein
METDFYAFFISFIQILKATSGDLTNGFKGYQKLNKTSKIITSSNPAISGSLIP